jgi:hypothetical protein
MFILLRHSCLCVCGLMCWCGLPAVPVGEQCGVYLPLIQDAHSAARRLVHQF